MHSRQRLLRARRWGSRIPPFLPDPARSSGSWILRQMGTDGQPTGDPSSQMANELSVARLGHAEQL